MNIFQHVGIISWESCQMMKTALLASVRRGGIASLNVFAVLHALFAERVATAKNKTAGPKSALASSSQENVNLKYVLLVFRIDQNVETMQSF